MEVSGLGFSITRTAPAPSSTGSSPPPSGTPEHEVTNDHNGWLFDGWQVHSIDLLNSGQIIFSPDYDLFGYNAIDRGLMGVWTSGKKEIGGWCWVEDCHNL